MKFFNPLLTVALWIVALSVSWSLYQNRPELLSWQFHARLQAGLQEFVANHIQEKIPDVTDIQFTSLWSRFIHNDEVEVFFEYQFQSPGHQTQSQLKGRALLNSNDDKENWTIKEVHIDEQSVEYAPEIIITPLTDDSKGSMPKKPNVDISSPITSDPVINTFTTTTASQSTQTHISQLVSTTTSSSSLSTLQSQSISSKPTSTIPVLPPIHLND